MKLIVCSPSTRKFLNGRKLILRGPPTKDRIGHWENTEKDVIAIGGGAVIDAAKIISKNPIVAYPTTGSGACCTSHAVMWDGKNKLSVKAHKPKMVIINSNFLNSVPTKVLKNSYYDAFAHCIDSLQSKNSTRKSRALANLSLTQMNKSNTRVEFIRAANLAGDAIEITGTNLLHSLSYPLTSYYGIPHGKALGFLLGEEKIDGIDMEFVIDEALKYPKIHDNIYKINKEKLRRWFK